MFMKGFCSGGGLVYECPTSVNPVMVSPEYGWTIIIEVKVKCSCLSVECPTIPVKCGDSVLCWCASMAACDKLAAYEPPIETGLWHVMC